ncbi:MAG: hypothetical protein CSA36_00845 [Draconibacterium sp.]|nr:MAG: hypothetical protein CSA36_00845 [Draconibacterium sp.]
MNNFFDNQRILLLIWRRKYHFIVVGTIAFIMAAIFSGPTFIKPKFKSTARIYPTNIWVLSNESETEQMLEVVNSNDIKIKMFDAFNLADVYKINRDDPHYLSYMMDIYSKNFKAVKTEFETVEISVMDEDPNRACNMCDSVIHFYNRKVGAMHKAKNLEMVEISGSLLEKKNAEIDSFSVVLNKVRKETGIIDFNSQVPEVTRGLMEALSAGRGATSDTREIKKLYNEMLAKGSEAFILENHMKRLVEEIDSLATVHEVNLSEYNKNISYCHVVQYPVPADKKSYPVRWLIAAVTTFSAVFLALIIFLVLDYRKEEA